MGVCYVIYCKHLKDYSNYLIMQRNILLKNRQYFFNLLDPKVKIIKNDNNNKTHQICFIGFQGSNLKKVRKYIDLYQELDQDFQITIFTPNYFQNYDQNYVYNAAYKLDEIINQENKKVIFHVMSGGAYPLSVLLNKMILDDNLNLIDKIIYDSAPVSCNFCSGVRALTETNKIIPKYLIEKTLSLYLYKAKLPMNTWCSGFYNILNSPLLHEKEKLFLTSIRDPLIPLEETMEFLKHQKNYQLVKFDSEHGKNIINDYQLYKRSIINFLKN